ncbi:hypothetical protein N7517_006529 [Penicillium concentricum]|uniref:Exonuclease domain-containing protein n=1 Tax=Penicillium concentricum TaxID=293559 RepID=A0A9W9S9L4_9EURO|nr:uncharacterized protein N7517_006529 [Penicillium concentricum]KAJ5374523.1 hypothetical protein N7517_006529 [Penicillium concentricum]
MSSDEHQKGEGPENRFTINSYGLEDIDPELRHSEVKKPIKVEPCWTRRTTDIKGRSKPKDPNMGPFPDLPQIVWTQDYWIRLWGQSNRYEATRGYQLFQMSSTCKERCKQCRLAMWGPRRQDLLASEYTMRDHAEVQANRAQQGDQDAPQVGELKEDIIDEQTEECIGKIYWTADMIAKWHKREAAKEAKRETKYGCWGHPGKPIFNCCKKNIFSRPCHQFKSHNIVDNQEAWKRNWELHEAPKKPTDYRFAIALDCEMGITDLGEQELIRVSAIDFFTGEILVNKLVFPKVRMWHTNFRFSGVTWDMLYRAKDRGEVLDGRDAAREALFCYMGPNTILMLHGGRGDMLALRIIHRRIVDTMRFAEASLKENARNFLNREIQQGPHDSLEDAIACRDLANHFITNIPFEHVYGSKYGHMWRGDGLDLGVTEIDGKIEPESRPLSENRVPYLKNFPRFERWVVEEGRRRAKELSLDEATAQGLHDQSWENNQGMPWEYYLRPEDDWASIPHDEAWDAEPQWHEPEDDCEKEDCRG